MNYGDVITKFMMAIQSIIAVAYFIAGNPAKGTYWIACVLANAAILRM